ncbi:N-acetylmuramoyl-L-alanine amidase [Planococcus shixiaomingii]|uniref:N-acetylmuramoyl-L-alanine amidase n=1 Tax=Planococcus shixiaomingii TaxID=3058393 RepID=UPI00261D70EB|nr:N-acetylmuramoyl-L-alanine amidase [Planococcus sp. N022]WKA54030.1 N-acetylmuramoyl-L-alanine amidase [Planococcus sp. N022]
MTTFIKTNVYLVIALLVMQLLPTQVLAAESEKLPELEFSKVTLSSNESGEIELFEEEAAETVLTTIPDGTVVDLTEEKEVISSIRYIQITPDGEPREWIGFVYTSTIKREEMPKEISDAPAPEEIEGIEEEALPKEEVAAEEKPAENAERSEPVSDEPKSEELEENKAPETATGDPEQAEPETAKELEPPIVELPSEEAATEEPASEEPTSAELPLEETPVLEAVEAAPTIEETEEVKEEDQPAVQDQATYTRAAVVSETLQGIALDQSTKVYKETTTSAAVLKTYSQGKVLKFHRYNSEWFSATVYVNGTAQTGFLHKSDIDLLIAEQVVKAYATADNVSVFKTPTRNAEVWKSYKFGHLLTLRTYSSQWYKATVVVNGQSQTGYIPVNDVSFDKPQTPDTGIVLKGVASGGPVSVYSGYTRDSKTLKTYGTGSILAYRDFSGNWYKTTVHVNGVSKTGYIHKADVEAITTNPQTVKGIGIKSPTRIYSKASTGSTTIKSYSLGTKLVYSTFSASWYKATVYIDGKAQTGYINKNDVEKITTTPVKLNGIGIKSPTKIYSRASTGAAAIKTYSYGSNLAFRSFTSKWYETTVYVNGKAKTGYIYKDDIVFSNGKIVYLDPGHGGKDGGAAANGIVEKTLVLDIGLRTEQLLKNAGFTVLMTRKTDVFLELAERTRLANASNADIFVSIHANAFNGYAKGIETFWYDKHEAAESKRLATELQKNLVDQMELSDRRVALGNYHVIRETEAPSALVEVGFIDNAIDAAKLKLNEYKQRAAEGIFAGLIAFFK